MLQILMLLFGATAAMAAASPEPAPSATVTIPKPFEVAYTASYRGIRGGTLHFEFHPGGKNTFVYATRAEPNLIARLLVSPDAVERSVMRIDDEGVRPLSWFKEDGKSGNEDDALLEFDWEKGVVTGLVEGEPVRLETVPGLQDHLSIQIAVITALVNDCEPGTIPMLDEDRIKHYTYTRKGTGSVKTEAGRFDAVLYEVTRPGSSRLSRIWHAPDLGYVPVRAEQLRKGKLETVIELKRLHRDTAP